MINRLKEIWNIYADEDNLLVYQFGKVGSTAIEDALPGSIHVHALYGNSPCHVHLKQRRSGVIRTLIGAIGDWIKRTALRTRKKIKIVTIVRDPIARNKSMFFQDLAHWIYYYMGRGNHDSRASGDEYLIDVFQEVFDHEYVDTWFDKELSRLVGFDVLEEDWVISEGFCILKKGRFEILICKYEQMSEWGRALEIFHGSKISLEKKNIGSEKWYGQNYNLFNSTFKPSKSYIDKMYSCRFVKKAYTSFEVAAFKNRHCEIYFK